MLLLAGRPLAAREPPRTVFTLLLLKFRPAPIPLWAVWVAVFLQAVVWISTATIQVPIQIALSTHGFSEPLLDRLIETNWWLRRVPYGACAGVFLWMAARVMGQAETNA